MCAERVKWSAPAPCVKGFAGGLVSRRVALGLLADWQVGGGAGFAVEESWAMVGNHAPDGLTKMLDPSLLFTGLLLSLFVSLLFSGPPWPLKSHALGTLVCHHQVATEPLRAEDPVQALLLRLGERRMKHDVTMWRPMAG